MFNGWVPHLTASEIELAKSIVGFLTVLVPFLSLLKKPTNQRTLEKKA